jgi:hypothetical protein
VRRGHIKAASFTHSAIYAGLLTCWIGGFAPDVKLVLGWGHGLGWFAMCALAVTGLRLRLIDLRLAVCIAVLGAVGPFIGTAEFVRQDRAQAGATEL